jgi:hypothetical protein
MPEEPYKNREIEEMFSDVKATLTRIETQTTKTNGRVGKLEKWQNFVVGFCVCMSIMFISIIIPLLAAFIAAHHL